MTDNRNREKTDGKQAARLVAAGVCLLLMTVGAYLPAMQGGFIWDDDDYVTHNRTLAPVEGLRQIWLDPRATPQYYPMVFTTFWVEYHLYGLGPMGYHAVNVLLHAANAVLLWRVLGRLQVPGAWWAAAIFALHPVHVESVAWITERKNVLSGFFYLSAFLAYLRFSPPTLAASPHAGRWYAAALFLFVGALLSKTVTCSLPAALLLVLWWQRDRLAWREVAFLAPFFLLGLLAALRTVWLEKHHVGALGEEWSLTWLDRCLVAGRALWFYLEKLFFPVELTFIYPRWRIDRGDWAQYLYPLGAILLTAALWLGRRRFGKGPLVAWLFFAGTLVPALGFFDIFPMRYSFVADHFQYLASIGPMALTAAVGALVWSKRASARQPLAFGTGGVILLLLGVLTWQQGRVYGGLRELWTDTIRKNPDCWMAHNNLGMLDLQQGRLAESRQHLEESLRLNPRNGEAWNNLGTFHLQQGSLDEAERALLEALRLSPDHPDVRNNLGSVYLTRGDLARAAEHIREALRLNPLRSQVQCNVGMLMDRRQEWDEALHHFAEALRLDPANTQAHVSSGLIHLRRGQLEESARHWQQAIRQQPQVGEYRLFLGCVLQVRGEVDLARSLYREAVAVSPLSPWEIGRMAWSLATAPDPPQRDGQLALRLTEAVCEATEYRDAVLLCTLAAAQAEVGRFAEAERTAQRALAQVSATQQPELVKRIEDTLKCYRQRMPYRDG